MIKGAVEKLLKKYRSPRIYRGARIRGKVAARDTKEGLREIDAIASEASPAYKKAKDVASSAIKSEYVQGVLKLAGKSTKAEASILRKQAKSIEDSIKRMQQLKRSGIESGELKKALNREAKKIAHAKKIINEVKAGKMARKGAAVGGAAYLASGDE